MYRYAQIDPAGGQITRSTKVGVDRCTTPFRWRARSPPDGAYLQGTVTGVLRIAAQ